MEYIILIAALVAMVFGADNLVIGSASIARRAALAHTFFNVFGVIWALALFRPFLSLVGIIITWLGYPNPALIDYAAGIEAGSAEAVEFSQPTIIRCGSSSAHISFLWVTSRKVWSDIPINIAQFGHIEYFCGAISIISEL